MPDRIAEADLVLPALLCMELGQPEISTTQLQRCLREMLHPTGEDLEILDGRNDDKFSQKVRNLRSHETLERPGWVTYERRGNNGYWRLTEPGRTVLSDHRELLEGVLSGRFPYGVQQDTFQSVQQQRTTSGRRGRVLIFDEDERVTEGMASQVAVQRRSRSRRLREIALERLEATDSLVCEACGFDFAEVYGERGQGYVEVHHRTPIFMYEDEDVEQTIENALRNLAPLCANCHRIVHRRRNDVWTVEQLRHVVKERRQAV